MQTITINTKALLKELTWANRFVDKKSTIPILSHVKLSANGAFTVTITGTDLEVSGMAAVQCVKSEPGAWAVAIPATQACRLLSVVETDSVELSMVEGPGCRISWGGGHSVLTGMSAENFPELPASIPAPTMKLSNFGIASKQVSSCISKEESRFTLNGAKIEVQEDGAARLISTDGHRLALSSLEVEDFVPYTGIISKFAMLEAAGMNGGSAMFGAGLVGDPPEEGKEDKRTEFHTFMSGNRIILARALKGNFPDWTRVMPSEDKIVDTVPVPQGFSKALKRVDLFTDERSRCFRMSVEGDELTLHAETVEKGKATEVLPLDAEHTSATVGLNASYVMEFLALAGKEEITWKHCGNGKDGFITGASIFEIPGLQVVVMPMKL